MWNGWACPRFSREEAEKVRDWINETGGRCWYEEVYDRFVTINQNGEALTPADAEYFDYWPGQDVEFEGTGSRAYAIGAWAWIWCEEGVHWDDPEQEDA